MPSEQPREYWVLVDRSTRRPVELIGGVGMLIVYRDRKRAEQTGEAIMKRNKKVDCESCRLGKEARGRPNKSIVSSASR